MPIIEFLEHFLFQRLPGISQLLFRFDIFELENQFLICLIESFVLKYKLSKLVFEVLFYNRSLKRIAFLN